MVRQVLIILILAVLWLILASFWHSVAQPLIQKPEVAYAANEWADPCGLEAVVCKDEIKEEYEAIKVARVISILETSGGRNVISGINNWTGIKIAGRYADFPSAQACLDYTATLWENRYANLPLDQALHNWKVGPRGEWTQSVYDYINRFRLIYTNS